MRALSQLFDATSLVVPMPRIGNRPGEICIAGNNLSIVSLTELAGHGRRRKLNMPIWLLRNFGTLLRETRRADAVHAPIPGDVGTFGILLALLLRKPLLVRHCGNWFVQRTIAERFWKGLMERIAGGRNVMLATGGAEARPSDKNPGVRWIFSTSLTEQELKSCYKQRQRPAPEQLRLIIICRQEVGKGTEVVIESLKLIMSDYPGATLDVVGDGGALPELREMVTAQGLDQRVTFHGKVHHDKVIELLQESDLFCYPTASEGFPKVVLEALACGLPVITTRVSVLPMLLQNGCGLLIEERTPRAVARAISECLADQDSYGKMSAQASVTAGQFSLERWRDTIGDLLREAWGPLRSDA
jgi:glycosyltransferase involved in cell wall biosynthesis